MARILLKPIFPLTRVSAAMKHFEKPAILPCFVLLWLAPLGLHAQATAPGPTGGNGNSQGRPELPVPTTDTADNNEREGHRHLWEARMQNGNYIVLVSKIAFVSKHEYVSDGVARVVEVTVASESSAVARFYYLEPIGSDSTLSAAQSVLDKARNLGREGARRAGQEGILGQVVKNYPATTHAHTVEYRLQTEEGLESLYGNLARTMATGKGRVFSEPGL